MFKVMVIDDEAIIRAGLKHSVDWSALGLEIVDEAKNGLEALEKLEKNPVDIVITDIRMPKMGGIDLLRSIKGKGYCQCVIFLSGYSEFTYAQQAVSLGAFDYILKPMDPNKIIEVLQRAILFLEDKKKEKQTSKNLEQKLEVNRTISREKILLDLLLGKELPCSLKEALIEYGIGLDMNSVQVALVEIEHSQFKYDKTVRDDTENLFESMKAVSSEIINKDGRLKCIYIHGDIDKLSLILQPATIADHIIFENTSMDILEKILLGIKNDLGLTAAISLGKVYESLDGLSLSYIDAKKALNYKSSIGSNRIICLSQVGSSIGKELIDLLGKEKNLISMIASGDNKASSYAEELFNRICTSCENNHIRIGTDLNNLCRGMAGLIREEHSYLNAVFDECKLIGVDFRTYEDINSMKHYFLYIVTELSGIMREYGLNQSDYMIRRACKYVLGHIEGEITLKSLAEYLGISKNYFCSLFKQVTGENFLEYLTRVKMERAKKLLKTGNYKAYEVSYMLGYEETGYFSKIFKKYTGHNPTEYRKNIK